jgi:DNA-binding beta-propeller fold protein YncE
MPAAALLGVLLAAGACARPERVLNRPNGVAVAADGTLLVVDKNHYRVVRLDAEGRFLEAFGGLGDSARHLPAPYDIALGPDGAIYVCDRAYSNGGSYKDHDGVKVFSPEGRFLREVGGEDYAAGEANNGPYGLDVDSGGNVWIVDYHRNRVRRYDPEGILVAAFGAQGEGPGELNGPNDVAVDESRGVVYVLEAINARVQRFTLDGTPLSTFGRYGRDDESFSYPQYLDLDPEGNLYITDMGNRRIKKYSPDGRYLAAIAPPDDGLDRQFLGLTVRRLPGSGGRERHEILVADTLNNRILVFDEETGLRATLG